MSTLAWSRKEKHWPRSSSVLVKELASGVVPHHDLQINFDTPDVCRDTVFWYSKHFMTQVEFL